MNAIKDKISEYIYSGSTKDLSLISDEQLLKLNLILNDIITNTGLDLGINIPRIVTVAQQSASKTTCIARLIGLDNLLPIGSTITTRAPLIMNCEYIESKESTIEIFRKEDSLNGKIESVKKLNIDFPHLTLEEQETVSDTITKITNSYVGVNSNVTDRPIILRIRSSKVSTMQLIDLPGITNVPLLSKGQSKNIKEVITKIINRYISDKNTIILGIFPARVDIEVDIALELIKQTDKNLERTIGVISKLDLMDSQDHVANYITNNNIVPDLKTKFGY